MDKRELYDSFNEMGQQTQVLLEQIELIKYEMTRVIEKNAELEIENQHLRERLHELEDKKKTSNETGLSKSRQNLEKLYEEGFHVCNVDNMYGSRRINDEPCVFCQDVIYGERR
ncbi:DNA replication initiation control protein YabA [Ligilactobacillus ceti]|uniref:DNA replication initiation control protein YabA n=1 Tax=Ligilactobacillus ceti TaxID=395085 RepID=UPI000418325C|nr:DNA replication initiation control protein YabA [Ligilactobacillus ceti]